MKRFWIAVAALAVLAGGCGGGGGGNTLPHVTASVARDCTNVRIPAPASRAAGEYTSESQSSIQCLQITTLVTSAEMGVVTSRVTVAEGNTKQFLAVLFDPVCSLVSPLEGYVWSVSGDIGTIDETGLFTPADVSSSVSGTVTVTYKGFSDSVPVTVSTSGVQVGCSTSAESSVSSAKDSLFKQTVTETDFNTAKTSVNAALADSPGCADANFLGSMLDVVDEIERLGTEVMVDGESSFPFTVDYVATEPLERTVRPILRRIPVVSRTLSEDSEISEFQAEIDENVIAVLESAIDKLDQARISIQAATDWNFTYPKDPANPQLGDESMDADDIDLFAGAIEIMTGFVYYFLAYDLDVPSSYPAADPCPEMNCTYVYPDYTCVVDDSNSALLNINTCEDADINGDNVLTASESFPPKPFGTVRSGGIENLGYAQSHITTGLSLINAAIDNIIDETEATVGGLTIGTTRLADMKHYQQYLTDLAQSFSGSTTDIVVPPTVDCWRDYGWGYYPTEVLDPAYNYSELVGCESTATSTQEITYTVNLGALFNVTDLRNIVPPVDMDEYGDAYYSSDIYNDTVGGIFPGGIQKEWFDYKTAQIWVYLNNVKSSSTGSVIPDLPESGITLAIGSKTYTASYVYSGTGYNYIDFTATFYSPPTISDYTTVNDYTGVTASLTVPGYQTKSFTIYGYGYSGDLTLTPQ